MFPVDVRIPEFAPNSIFFNGCNGLQSMQVFKLIRINRMDIYIWFHVRIFFM